LSEKKRASDLKSRSVATGVSAEDLLEQAKDWSLIALLLSRPHAGWREQLRGAVRGVVDPELCVAVELAQREANEYFYECLMGAAGLLASRESDYRPDRDQGPLLADLRGMAEAYSFQRFGSEPEDHIVALTAFMSHLLSCRAEAIVRGDAGEELYLAGAVDWLCEAHLKWYAERLASSLIDTEVCYLSHAAHALVQRVQRPGSPDDARERPSDESRDAGADNLKRVG